MEELINKNVSLVLTPELELCIQIMPASEGVELLRALLRYLRGELVDTDNMFFKTLEAYNYFTGPDYNITDLILPRLTK